MWAFDKVRHQACTQAACQLFCASVGPRDPPCCTSTLTVLGIAPVFGGICSWQSSCQGARGLMPLNLQDSALPPGSVDKFLVELMHNMTAALTQARAAPLGFAGLCTVLRWRGPVPAGACM